MSWKLLGVPKTTTATRELAETSTLLSSAEKLPPLYVTTEEYRCETLKDVADLYGTFDSKMQSRTSRDIYMSFASTAPELNDVNTKIIMICVSGISYHKLGDQLYVQSQPCERAELLLDYVDFVQWVQGIMKTGPEGKEIGRGSKSRSPHLLRMPVAAAMLACWSKSPEKATEFWLAVRDETGSSPNSPDRKLSRYLLTTNLASGIASRMKTAPAREMYVKAIHAWNAWRKGSTTNLNYYSDAEVPVAC